MSSIAGCAAAPVLLVGLCQSVMVKVPDPLHPAPVPTSVQLPVMELLLSVPSSVSVLDPLVFPLPDAMVSWKVPVATPPEVPVAVNAPVAVVPRAKHEEEVVKLRLVTVSALPFCARVAVKARAWVPSELVNVAVQLPLIEPLELPPQPDHAITIKSIIAMPKRFIESSTKNEKMIGDAQCAPS